MGPHSPALLGGSHFAVVPPAVGSWNWWAFKSFCDSMRVDVGWCFLIVLLMSVQSVIFTDRLTELSSFAGLCCNLCVCR